MVEFVELPKNTQKIRWLEALFFCKLVPSAKTWPKWKIARNSSTV